ncbi:MAG: cell division protein ZapA [Crocinitomicaceae bacterium]|jgi:cell division protein ZapA
MSKVSLKISLCGRTYPITVAEQEQTRVLEAAKQINEAIDQLKKSYAVNDSQDLLAMASLQLLIKSHANSNNATYKQIEQKLADLDQELSKLGA